MDECPSCGVPYAEHIGLIGACAEVKRLTAALAEKEARLALVKARAKEVVNRYKSGFHREQKEHERLTGILAEKEAECDQYKTLWLETSNLLHRAKQEITTAHQSGIFEGRESMREEAAAMGHEIWAMSQLVPNEGIEDGIDRIESAIRSIPITKKGE